MGILESTIENCGNAYAKKKYGTRVLIRKMNGHGFRNWPDRGYWFDDGIHFMIEYKAPGKKPEPAQVEFHRRMAALGIRVYVADNAELAKNIIDAEAAGTPLMHLCAEV